MFAWDQQQWLAIQSRVSSSAAFKYLQPRLERWTSSDTFARDCVAAGGLVAGLLWLRQRRRCRRGNSCGAVCADLAVSRPTGHTDSTALLAELHAVDLKLDGLPYPQEPPRLPFQSVVELDISASGVTELPSAINLLAGSLVRLNAAKNPLSSLPASFVELRKVRVLFFLGCEFVTVPAVLGALPSLFMLSFKSNRLEEIPEDALAASIGWLILTDNRLKELPRSIGRLTGLRKLMLAGNRLKRLPREISRCVHLELVRLASNDLEHPPRHLLCLPRLAWVALANNPFSRKWASKRQSSPAASGGGHGTAPVPPVIPIEQVHLDTSVGGILGKGASGIVRRGRLYDQSHGPDVAVKLFHDGAITSDGCPQDELAATLAAGSSDHTSLMRCLARVSPSAVGGNEGAGGGLVFELLRGWKALGNPPSFDSVTRDVFAPNVSLALCEMMSIAHGVAGAAATIHAIGLCHGDLYAHNVMTCPPTAGGDKTLSAPAATCILSDFGAGFFYEEECEGQEDCLFEQIEVRAFGLFLEELLDLLLPSSTPVHPLLTRDAVGPEESAVVLALRTLADHCTDLVVAARPRFADILVMLDATWPHASLCLLKQKKTQGRARRRPPPQRQTPAKLPPSRPKTTPTRQRPSLQQWQTPSPRGEFLRSAPNSGKTRRSTSQERKRRGRGIRTGEISSAPRERRTNGISSAPRESAEERMWANKVKEAEILLDLEQAKIKAKEDQDGRRAAAAALEVSTHLVLLLPSDVEQDPRVCLRRRV